MNARELRAALFFVDNQGLTVAQLRAILFDIEDQDATLRDHFDTVAQATTGASPAHKCINTVTGVIFVDEDVQTDGQFVKWVENYLDESEIACRAERDANGNEVLIPLHRKLAFRKWSQQTANAIAVA